MIERDVLIVGAGAAGLACAHRLARTSLDFLVLEAKDRVGGRIFTDYSLARGYPLETGAFYIHGKRVITHAWAREFGLHVRKMPLLQRARFWIKGRYARFPYMAMPFHPTMGLRAFHQGAFRIPRVLEEHKGADTSLAAFLDEIHARPGARSLVTVLRAHASAADPDEVGVRGPAEEDALATEEFGYSNFQIMEGYSRLITDRAAGMIDRIRLSTRVTEIAHSPRGVRISATGADGQVQELRARRAVVTLPLGVLKAGGVTFDPPLSQSKQEAIDAIAFGHAVVLVIRLREHALVERLGDFGLLWGEGASTFHRPYVRLKNRPEILTAFVVGREAKKRAQLRDEEALVETLAELHGILPSDLREGAVDACMVRRWSTDPQVLGGYSFLPPNVGVAHRRALAEPADGVLFFAGEATHAGGESATVHGAIETGYRAADEILHSFRAGST